MHPLHTYLPTDLVHLIESLVTHMNYGEVLTEFYPYTYTVEYIEKLHNNCNPSCIQDPLQYHVTQIHSNMDVLDYVGEDTLKRNAAIIATFVYHAAMRDEMMPRKKAIDR